MKANIEILNDFMDALTHCDTVKVILTGCGEKNFTTKEIYNAIAETFNRKTELEDKLEQGTLIEKTMEPTELQSLIALVLEIGDSADHYISFHLSKSKTVDLLDVTVYDKEIEKADCIAECQHLTVENIEKCRAELLKYKEW